MRACVHACKLRVLLCVDVCEFVSGDRESGEERERERESDIKEAKRPPDFVQRDNVCVVCVCVCASLRESTCTNLCVCVCVCVCVQV